MDFIKPGRGKVTARFVVKEKQSEDILKKTADGQKYLPEFSVEIKDEEGDTVARATKTLYIRKKP